MNASKPISSARAVQLLFGLAKQRFSNRWRSAYSRKTNDPNEPTPSYSDRAGLISASEQKRRALVGGYPPPKPTSEEPLRQLKRIGTGTKSAGIGGLAVFLSLGMFFNGFNIASNTLSQLLNSTRGIVKTTGLYQVSQYTYDKILETTEELRAASQIQDTSERNQKQSSLKDYLSRLLAWEVDQENVQEDVKSYRIAALHRAYDQMGSDGFYIEHPANSTFIGTGDWPKADKEHGLISSIGFLFGLFALGTVAMSLGLNNKDLGQVDWGFKWLYTLPVSARSLYFSQLINGAVFNPPLWMFLVPLLIRAFLVSSWSWASLFMALAVSAYYAILCGSLAMVVEVAARKYLKLSQLKSLQAIFTVLGMAFLLAYLACISRPVADFYAKIAMHLPSMMLWQPFSMPAFLLSRNATPWHYAAILSALVIWAMIALTSILVCEWLTREGLIRAGGPYQGARKKSISPVRRQWLAGVPAKEMRLLIRDHNFMVQVLVVPLIVIAYYLIVNSSLLAAARGNFHHAATLAFCVGAYGLTTSAMQILNHEKATLWQLYTFPRSIISIMVEKTLVWAGFALLYASITLATFGYFSRQLHYSAWVDTFIALYGVVLYAFIAGGIGILATNVLDPTPKGRIRADMAYLNLFLIGMYAYAIYSPSFWDKLAQLVLSTLLAYALWQKAKDRLPYLLDPEISPPPEVSLADGLIAALAFFVLQGFLDIIFQHGEPAPTGMEITLAYGISGITISFLMMIALTSRKIPDLSGYLGFAITKFRSGFEAVTKSVALGLFGGGIAALGAAIYLHVLSLVPSWEAWKEQSVNQSFLFSQSNFLWMMLLLVVAAPLCEEFIFRGLVFRGLRRSLHPALAVLASAALFALVHPPVSVIPVFGLGLATAIVFERTRLLLAPIVAHAMYNACVILLNHR